ncbi:hypothetical protein HHK36_007388 [Tetracentron sinense]|uniref:Uncharacterized protein n=1 Tax=Tetracentron sinense TaxID=13715 RepID=A0A835DLR5_TETSI|nr:hypothetical protein HHK36_007388 [Tetracentron sinense]
MGEGETKTDFEVGINEGICESENDISVEEDNDGDEPGNKEDAPLFYLCIYLLLKNEQCEARYWIYSSCFVMKIHQFLRGSAQFYC